MTQAQDDYAALRDERIRNYFRVVNERFERDVEELTRGVNCLRRSRDDWNSAVALVDDPNIGAVERAVMFHRLIEQGAGDALQEGPGEWGIGGSRVEGGIRFRSSSFAKVKEAMDLTAPERIARVVQRIRNEFPHLVEEAMDESDD